MAKEWGQRNRTEVRQDRSGSSELGTGTLSVTQFMTASLAWQKRKTLAGDFVMFSGVTHRNLTNQLILVTLLSLLLGVSQAPAVPAQEPEKDDLIDRADLIAVISFSKVERKVTRKLISRKPKHVLEWAHARVETVAKGNSQHAITVVYEFNPEIACRAEGLKPGRYLAFLKPRRGGTESEYRYGWYTLFPIRDNQVVIWRRQPLETALAEIEESVKKAAK